MRRKRRICLTCCALFTAVSVRVAAAKPLAIVDGNSSGYRIYHVTDAPDSVKRAAGEIQRVILASTGVKLPIVEQPASPMIALGDSRAAAEAGLRGQEIAFEGYRIVTRKSDVFIVGHDVPQGEEKWYRQWSYGTLSGAYTFLENTVGARWLMPGPVGEDIPKHDRLLMESTDIREAPCFRFRALAYVQGRRNRVVQEWKTRHKVHVRYRISFPHAFDDYPSKEVLEQHPEYMALQNDGLRQPVPTKDHAGHWYCLTDPDLQRAYAEAIMERWVKRPDRWHASLSPSDSSRYCECPRCKKLVERDDRGLWGNYAERGWSMTPVMLQFYNAVGKIVGEKFPDHIVGGHIYRSYTYPPHEVMRMAPNVVLNIAVLDQYGYKLYKPERADEFRRLYPAWSKFSGLLAHTDYSTWMRDWYGLPLPPAKPILKLMYPILKKYKLLFVNHTGHSNWGTGAVHNYIVAKLLWDAGADIDALYDEFLRRAYGPKAAPHIDRIYALSEEALSSYIRAHKGFRQPPYNSTFELVTRYYAPLFPEFEKLYSAAYEAADTDAQRRRLERFGDQLTLLHFNLNSAGVLKDAEASRFYKSAEDFKRFLDARKHSLALGPHQKPDADGNMKVLFSPEDRKVAISFLPPDAAPPTIDGKLDDAAWGEAAMVTGFRLRGSRHEATQQTEVRLMFDRDNLYLGVRCFDENIAGILRGAKGHDSTALFNDDTFELFIGHRSTFKDTYWHVAFNPNGAWYDNVALEREYNLEFKHAAEVGEKSWRIEMAIPFKSLGLDEPPFGKTWRGNFCRTRKPEPREVSAWASIEEGFHDPKVFGEWIFSRR